MNTHARKRRAIGIAAGIGTHLLFAFTVWHLFWFLKGRPGLTSDNWLVMDALLSVQFAIPHSILLLPTIRRRISTVVGSPFYGLLFCVATCASLLLVFAFWRTSVTSVWALSGFGKIAISSAFIGAWVALLYSINLTGLGYQTGLTPWLAWLYGRDQPRRGFQPRGAYLWLRHPVYLSFLGLVWFNPEMSLDRLLLAGIWSGYIFVGSCLKDRRMEFYVGQPYREYQARVSGFPLMLFGPQAKRLPTSKVALEERSMSERPDTTSRMAA